MEKQYLVVWSDGTSTRHTIVKLATPPHCQLSSAELREMLVGALPTWHDTRLISALELGNPAWSNGQVLDLVTHDDRTANVACSGGAWRIHI